MDQRAYRKLEAWQIAMDLVEAVYGVARLLPADERFGLSSQLRRAATSVPANIAEGYGRSHRGDYLRHLSIARGSLMEVETHLLVAHRLKMVDQAQVVDAWRLCQRVGAMLTQLIRSLSAETPAPQPETRSI